MSRLVNTSTGRSRLCLITGAASGIGRATALAFARESAHVIVTDLSTAEPAAKELIEEICQSGGKASWYALDTTQEDQWKNVIEQVERDLGPLDVLVILSSLY
jgi:NAD(P)-dependent dehydrogenase (short-subunit alcohol dehydrogenase family)